jgi:ATP-dependent NAD(P)H-hydrate dehydratase
MSSTPSKTQSLVSKIIPTLSQSLHKGSCGRIGILGGSVEYSGSPFFAGIAALRTGADLCYILCHKEAAPIIKVVFYAIVSFT